MFFIIGVFILYVVFNITMKQYERMKKERDEAMQHKNIELLHGEYDDL
jgi:predicted adenine nucleotide alpha hydrolase (AANH) superfamily ATPase